MKTLISTKSLASNANKKLSSRLSKHMHIPPNSEELIFEKKIQLIINTNALPVVLSVHGVQKSSNSELILTINSNAIKGKHGEQMINFNIHMVNKKWLRLVFWQKYERLTIKKQESQNKLRKSHVYCDLEEWKLGHIEDWKFMNTISMKDILINREQKTECLSKGSVHLLQGKRTISTLLKNKMSERNSSFNMTRNKILPFLSKQKERMPIHPDTSQLPQPKGYLPQKYDSSTIEISAVQHQRETNTSISVRRDIFESKISKKLKKLKDVMIESKIGKSEKQTSIGGDYSHLNDDQCKKHNFQWNLNISQQEFQIRKRKFDSQCIPEQFKSNQIKKTAQPQKEEQKQQEQSVAQEICRSKLMSSHQKIANSFDDTFQAQQKKQEESKLDQSVMIESESGTLYQSIYQ